MNVTRYFGHAKRCRVTAADLSSKHYRTKMSAFEWAYRTWPPAITSSFFFFPPLRVLILFSTRLNWTWKWIVQGWLEGNQKIVDMQSTFILRGPLCKVLCTDINRLTSWLLGNLSGYRWTRSNCLPSFLQSLFKLILKKSAIYFREYLSSFTLHWIVTVNICCSHQCL